MKKILFPILAIVLAVGLALPMAAPVTAAGPPNLVANGSFETPVVIHAKLWNIFDSGTAGLGWTAEWYDGSTSHSGQARPSTAYLELHRGVKGWLPYDGQQYAELDTDWDGPDGSLSGEPASVTIYQDLDTVPGGIYELSFVFSPRPDETDNQLEVKWDGAVVDTPSASGTGLSNTKWTAHSYPVTASTATTRLEFTDLSAPDALGTFLDAVSVTAQPGTIIVEKITDPSPDTTDTSFDFTAGGLAPTSFSLKNGESHTFNDVPVGSGYNISETVPAGWDLTSATCSDGSPTDNIDVGPGETVTVTFTNTLQLGKITGHKYRCDASGNCTDEGLEGWIINLEGTTWDGKPVSRATTTGTGGYYDFTCLPDGTYTVTETLKPGWENCTPTSYQITLCNGQQVVVSDTNTMVTTGNSTPPDHAAMYSWEPYLSDPNPPDPNNSVWDQGVASTHVFGNGADWIWESYRVVHPVLGDVVEFERTFYIPGNPTGGALHITCDNGYEVYMNGSFVGSALVHDISGQDWETSDLTEPYVNTTGWQTVQSYHQGVDFSLQGGNNTLVIKAANEYMGPPEQSNGTEYSNPAGLIFELLYDSDVNFCNRELGSITIVKDADPADGTDFEFTGDLGSFILDDATPDDSDGISDTTTFSNLTWGDYDVTEIVPAGWTLDNINCTGGDSTPIADGVTVHLDPGEDITVTFTNTRLCEITGHKYLCDESDNCTQTGLPGWTITLDGPNGTTGNTTDSNGYYEFTGLFDGTYTLSETMQDGWVNCTPTSYEITLDNCQIHGRGVIVSDTNTLVTAGNAGTHPHNAVYAWEHSTWWPGLSYKFGYPNNDARWIWESYRVVHPIAGDIVEFQRSFYIPGTPTDNCTLYITCDNGYEVTLNGNPVGSAQLGASWETSNLTQSFVDTTNWQSVESYDASGLLQSGNNTLVIKTANEYMGDLDGQQDGTIDENPAGLIYELLYEFDTTEINFCNREGIPNITIIKTADPTAIMSGEQVTYTYQVTNTGDVDLTSITITDDQSGVTPAYVGGDDGDGVLNPGETWTYEATANPTGDVTNTGTACGTDSTQQQVCAEDTATVEVLKPQVSISGHKYRCDASDNCTQEGLEGWTMNLTGPVSGTTTTDNITGYYEFTDLPDGTYTVSEELKSGWENCTPDSYQITLCNGQFVVASDNNTMVTAGNVGGVTTYPYNAVEAWEYNLSYPNPPDPNNSDWDQAVSSTHAFSNCADWIWESEFVVNPAVEETVEFERSFYIPGTPAGGTLHITCDNGYEVKLNGTIIGVDGDWTTVETYNVLADLQSGNNLMEITATNLQTPGSTPTTNPAGLIYELFYDSDVNFCNRQLGTITIVKEVIGDAPESDWEFTSDNITDFSIAAAGGSHIHRITSPQVRTPSPRPPRQAMHHR